jgi:hypothetical protein
VAKINVNLLMGLTSRISLMLLNILRKCTIVVGNILPQYLTLVLNILTRWISTACIRSMKCLVQV